MELKQVPDLPGHSSPYTYLQEHYDTYSLILNCFVYVWQDGLLSQGYGDLINRLHAQIPKVTNDGKRLQMVVCSATLHSFDVKKMAVSFQWLNTWQDFSMVFNSAGNIHLTPAYERQSHAWLCINLIGADLRSDIKYHNFEYVVKQPNLKFVTDGVIFCHAYKQD